MKRWMDYLFVLLFVLLASSPIWATEITPTAVKGPYPTTGIQAGDLDCATSALQDCTFTVKGRELLVISNTGVSSATFCIYAATDEFGMKTDVSGTIQSGSCAVFWFGSDKGWDDGSGVRITSSTTTIEWTLLEINGARKRMSAISTAFDYETTAVRGPFPSAAQAQNLSATMTPGITSITTARFINTGSEIAVIWNKGSTSHTFYLYGYKTSTGRTLSTYAWQYTLSPGEWAAWQFSNPLGWANANGHTNISCNSAELYVGILQIP